MRNISILIADDHMLIRQGFKRLLERQEGLTIIGEAKDGIEAIDKTIELNPDILLLDINMPKLNGLDALKKIKKNNNFQKVIMLTIHDTKEYVSESIRLGANGYISKNADLKLLLDAIVSVYDGSLYIQPTISSTPSIESYHSGPLNNRKEGRLELEEKLTDREIEVLKLVTRGHSNKEISSSLGAAEKTIRNHLYSIFKKIDVSDRTQAAIFGLENDIDIIAKKKGL